MHNDAKKIEKSIQELKNTSNIGKEKVAFFQIHYLFFIAKLILTIVFSLQNFIATT